MKNLFAMSIWMLSFLFISCAGEETYYSCDPDVDMWIKENLEEVQSIGANSFRAFDVSYRLAIFNAITPEKRVEIWKEKVSETLKLDWSIAEIKHIEQLFAIIEDNIEWYHTGVPDEDLEKYEKTAYRWVDYAKEELKWNNELVAAIAASPLFLSNTRGELISPSLQTIVRVKNGSENCTCNPVVSFCSPCRYDPCNKTNWGCGFLGLGICNGLGC